MRRAMRVLMGLILASWPVLVTAQVTPIGSEFQINTYTTGNQHAPAVALDAAGNFVTVWHSPQDGNRNGVFGQLSNSSGVKIGSEFQVNTYTTGYQGYAAVGRSAAGNFVVVWTSGCANSQDGNGCGVFGQRFNDAATRLGTEFLVNTYTTANQDSSAIAMNAAGNFVVVWRSGGAHDGSGLGVFAQLFNSTGTALGTEFQINTYTTGDQGSYPLTVATSTNQFIVAWHGDAQDGSGRGIFAQRLATSGVPLGTEFQVNSYTTNDQRYPAVATDLAGNFVIVWTDLGGQDGSSGGVFGQRYASNGTPRGTEFQVNTYTTGYQQTYPSSDIASDAAGNFVVVWTSPGQDGSLRGVFGQRFSSDGTQLGTEFQINTYTTSYQDYPAVVSDSAGNFIVVWQSGPGSGAGQDGDARGIFAQRFSVPAPPAPAPQPQLAPAVGQIGLTVLGFSLLLLGAMQLVRRRRA